MAVEPVPRNLTYNGREQTLVTRGTPVNGHMEYSFDDYDDYSTALPKGTDAGIYEVWYKVVGDDGTETDPESVIAEILPRTVIPTVTVNLTSDPLPYTGRPQKPPVTVIVEGKTLTNNVDYTTTYSNNTNVGTATVNVQSVSGKNYQFSGTATFEIARARGQDRLGLYWRASGAYRRAYRHISGGSRGLFAECCHVFRRNSDRD